MFFSTHKFAELDADTDLNVVCCALLVPGCMMGQCRGSINVCSTELLGMDTNGYIPMISHGGQT
jgi:hypothetical protein